MSDWLLRRLGLATFVLIPALAFGVIEGMGILVPPTGTGRPLPTADERDSAQADHADPVGAAASPLLEAKIPISVATVPAVGGSTSSSVQDSDLMKLGAMVDLANAGQGAPDRDRWTRAVAIAQNLLQAPCDCEQRNWLTHFVTMGNAALSGSPEYYRLSHVLPTLALNDQRNSHY